MESQGAHEAGELPRGWARLHPRGQGVDALMLILSLVFFIFSESSSVDFQVIPRTFISAQK